MSNCPPSRSLVEAAAAEMCYQPGEEIRFLLCNTIAQYAYRAMPKEPLQPRLQIADLHPLGGAGHTVPQTASIKAHPATPPRTRPYGNRISPARMLLANPFS